MIMPSQTNVTSYAHSLPDMIALQEFLARQPGTNKRAKAAAVHMLELLIDAAESFIRPGLKEAMDEIVKDLPKRR